MWLGGSIMQFKLINRLTATDVDMCEYDSLTYNAHVPVHHTPSGLSGLGAPAGRVVSCNGPAGCCTHRTLQADLPSPPPPDPSTSAPIAIRSDPWCCRRKLKGTYYLGKSGASTVIMHQQQVEKRTFRQLSAAEVCVRDSGSKVAETGPVCGRERAG